MKKYMFSNPTPLKKEEECDESYSEIYIYIDDKNN